MRTRVVLCLLALSVGGATLHAQGRVDEVRREVRQPSPPESGQNAPSSNSSHSSCSSTDEDDEDGSFFGLLLVGAFEAIFKANQGTRFQPYPYFGESAGLMWVPRRDADGDPESPPLDEPLRIFSGRLRVEDGNDFRGVNCLGGQLMLDTACGLGVRAGYQWLHERFACGCSDDLGLGDVNLLFRLISLERFQMHVGLGCVFLSDARRTDAGFNATASFDVFPVRPVVISTQFDLGNIGSATVSHARGTVGYQWRRWELFGGYDFLRIGSVNLQGPVAGVRLWF